MYKFVTIFALIAVACAAPKPGYLASPTLYHSAPLVSAPVVSAPVVAHSVPVATSYANTYKVAYKSPLIASPVAYTAHAAPVAVHSPVAVAHAPVAYSSHALPLAYAAHASPVAVLH